MLAPRFAGRFTKPAAEPPLRASQDRDGAMTWSLIRTLETSARFRRDGPIGGIFHPGRISFRELSPRDSLHIIIDGNRVSAHVDDVCPVRCRTEDASGYTAALVIAHNLSGMLADLGRRIRGLHGTQRCNLGCEMVWVEDDEIAELAAGVEAGGSSDHHACCEDQP